MLVEVALVEEEEEEEEEEGSSEVGSSGNASLSEKVVLVPPAGRPGQSVG